MRPELESKIRQYLNGERKMLCYLATVDADAGYIPEIRTMTLLECDWHFYIATSSDSRKTREMLNYPKAAFLVHLRDEKYVGYLRLTGSVKPITDIGTRQKVAETTKYPIDCRYQGYSDPNLFFAQISPYRVEFMAPGEDVASDITAEFLQ